MAARKKRRKKLCPEGVMKDCKYCIERRGRVWLILDPRGMTIDEANTQTKAMGIADGYVSQCIAASSGYGGKMEYGKDGEFKWEGLGRRTARGQA